MHPNPAFRQTSADDALRIARARGFGVLSVNSEAGPLAAHIPFEISPDGTELTLHLARSNAIARAALPAPAVMIVSGPDAYVSPDWYGVLDQVPTWNYVAVHLRGMLHPLPDEALRPHLDAVTAHFEAGLQPKKPWVAEKMSDGVMERMMRGIRPFRLVVAGVESTVKLNQNKEAAAREGAAAGLAVRPDAGSQAIAALMRG
jgi:transcriptional regulator